MFYLSQHDFLEGLKDEIFLGKKLGVLRIQVEPITFRLRFRQVTPQINSGPLVNLLSMGSVAKIDIFLPSQIISRCLLGIMIALSRRKAQAGHPN